MFPRVKVWVSGFGVLALIISHNSVTRISKTTWSLTFGVQCGCGSILLYHRSPLENCLLASEYAFMKGLASYLTLRDFSSTPWALCWHWNGQEGSTPLVHYLCALVTCIYFFTLWSYTIYQTISFYSFNKQNSAKPSVSSQAK